MKVANKDNKNKDNKNKDIKSKDIKSKDIKNILFDNISNDWVNLLDNSSLDDIVNKINFKKATPSISYIFNFARLTNINNIKLIIINQEPFHKEDESNGLAFSCINYIQISLSHIYTYLFNNKLIEHYPDNGNIKSWALNGVLLLNMALTTNINKVSSHTDIWNDYMLDVIKNISIKKDYIYLLFNMDTANLSNYITNINKNNKVFICSDFKSITNTFDIITKEINIDWCLSDNSKYMDIIDGFKIPVLNSPNEKIPVLNSPNEKIPVLNFPNIKNTIVAFTDGSCNPNRSCPEAKGGYSSNIVIGPYYDTIIYGSIETNITYATNQRAEGYAIYKTLEFIYDKLCENDEQLSQLNTIIIVTDSDFWINMYQKFMPSWAKTNSFKEKKNSDITIPSYNIYYLLDQNYGITVKFLHIQSHGKNNWNLYHKYSYKRFCYECNEYVDELAKHATSLNKGEHIIEKLQYDE